MACSSSRIRSVTPSASAPAGTALADHDADGRHPQGGPSRAGSWRSPRPGPAPSAPNPGYAPGVVDQRDHGPPELLGHLHEPERLAVSLRVRHAEVAAQVVLHVAALLVPDHHDGPAVEPRPPPDDRLVVAVAPVAPELEPVGEYAVDVVERVGTARMAGDLHLLHRPSGSGTSPRAGHRVSRSGPVPRPARPGPRLAAMSRQPGDLPLYLDDVPLEGEMRCGRHPVCSLLELQGIR